MSNVDKKLNRRGLSIITEKEKKEIVDTLLEAKELLEKQNCINKMYEELNSKNLTTLIRIEKKHNNLIKLLEKSLQEADKKLKQEKDDYVNHRTSSTRVNKYIGYYNALDDLIRKVEIIGRI